MTLKLRKASYEYRDQIVDMLEEWTAYNREHPGCNTSPAVIFSQDYHDFSRYMDKLNSPVLEEGMVPASTFFCFDEERNAMVGAVNIRHELNDYLLKFSGHIGDGVRPSMRRKGYATEMIGLALEECRRLGMEKVLMVCNRMNTGSRKSIMNNGGILENEMVNEKGITLQRYWIML